MTHFNDLRSCYYRKAGLCCSNAAEKNNERFQNFFSQFKQLNIIKDLTDKIDLWSYNKLDEVKKISPIIIEKMKQNGII